MAQRRRIDCGGRAVPALPVCLAVVTYDFSLRVLVYATGLPIPGVGLDLRYGVDQCLVFQAATSLFG